MSLSLATLDELAFLTPAQKPTAPAMPTPMRKRRKENIRLDYRDTAVCAVPLDREGLTRPGSGNSGRVVHRIKRKRSSRPRRRKLIGVVHEELEVTCLVSREIWSLRKDSPRPRRTNPSKRRDVCGKCDGVDLVLAKAGRCGVALRTDPSLCSKRVSSRRSASGLDSSQLVCADFVTDLYDIRRDLESDRCL